MQVKCSASDRRPPADYDLPKKVVRVSYGKRGTSRISVNETSSRKSAFKCYIVLLVRANALIELYKRANVLFASVTQVLPMRLTALLMEKESAVITCMYRQRILRPQ